jgi:chromosome segregation ATPase
MTPERIKELRKHADEHKGVIVSASEMHELLDTVEQQAGELEEAHTAYARMFAKLNNALTGRDAAVEQMERVSRELGELRGMKDLMAFKGVIEGWREKCGRLEAERDTAVAENARLREALNYYAKDYDHERRCSKWDGGEIARVALNQKD